MNTYKKVFWVGAILAYFLGGGVIQADSLRPQVQLANNASSLAISATMLHEGIPLIPDVLKTLWVTAYTSVPDETDDTPFITANGTYVHDGIVASNFLPFGTKVQIPELFGSKVFTVEDRMNKKYGGRLDIWMPTVTGAINFGIRRARVVILNSPDLAMK